MDTKDMPLLYCDPLLDAYEYIAHMKVWMAERGYGPDFTIDDLREATISEGWPKDVALDEVGMYRYHMDIITKSDPSPEEIND